jgi:hypothetical protein
LQKAEGEITRLQPLVQRARRLPVTTSFERVSGSAFEFVSGAHTLTLHINNPFPQPLSVVVTVANAAKTTSQAVTIAGGSTLNVEKLAEGDKVLIASEGYDPVNLTAQ